MGNWAKQGGKSGRQKGGRREVRKSEYESSEDSGTHHHVSGWEDMGTHCNASNDDGRTVEKIARPGTNDFMFK